ncbi:MAG TPA: hypothetical protein VK211_15380 [Kamptonema sp.]|nr:hypothetical protein [Kamptonema sp.]
MTTGLNQKLIVSVPASGGQAQIENPAETAQELPPTVQPTDQFEAEGNARLKAMARVAMVGLAWSLAGLTKRS